MAATRRQMFGALLSCLLFLGFAAPSSASWTSDGSAVCTTTGWHGEPELIADGSGGVIITWSDSRIDSTYDIYAQRLSSTGVPLWPADGVVVCNAPYDQIRPLIISDGNGGSVIVWWDTRNTGANANVSGSETDIYAQRIDANGAPQWGVNGVPVCAVDGRQWFPSAIADGNGGIIVTWADNRSEEGDDVYAQWLNGSGDPQWTVGGVILAEPGVQSIPTIVSDGASGAIISWYDFRNGIADIYAQRVSEAGAMMWTTNGGAVCTATGSQSSPWTVADNGGGAIIVWTDFRSPSNGDIYAQRLNAAGAPQWTPDGIAVCSASGNQSQCVATSDGAGGATVAWVDPRSYSLTRQDVYAQRLNPSGAAMWATNGVVVCASAQIQFELSVTNDGNGGAVVTWADARDDVNGYVYDIYAQRINAAGSSVWSSNGVAVCKAPDGQYEPRIVADGAGGVVVTWQDSRSHESSDVYALRLGLSGQLPSEVGSTPSISPLRLSPNTPNPFSQTTSLDLYSAKAFDGAMDVYDVAGRRVLHAPLSVSTGGWQSIRFDGRDAHGHELASGVYFLRVSGSGLSSTRKVVIQR